MCIYWLRKPIASPAPSKKLGLCLCRFHPSPFNSSKLSRLLPLRKKKMPFVRALYFPRLEDSTRQSPPPRLIRLEVILENHTWHADVRAFFNSTEIENFIIDGSSHEATSPRKCCEVNEEGCLCSTIETQKWPRRHWKELVDTSYMMTFAAITSKDDCDNDKPLLEREFESEPGENCWTREFVFFKLNGGYPIDIGTEPGYGISGAIMAADIELLQNFFTKLVRDQDLVKRRFTPGVEEDSSASKPKQRRRSTTQHNGGYPESTKLTSLQPKSHLSFARDSTRPNAFSIRRTQSTRHKPSWDSNCMRTTKAATESLKFTRSPPAPLATIQKRLHLSRKHRAKLNSEETQRVKECPTPSPRSWLHFV